MEGYSENSSADKKDDKSEKKVGKAAGLGSRTFEFANKKQTAEKIADASSIWEKLIPKESPDKAKEKLEAKTDDTKAELETAEAPSIESAEEASDPSVENLSPGEKAEVVKEYVREKTGVLEAGRSDAEDPAEAAVRDANIEFLKNLEAGAETTPLEPVEAVLEEMPEAVAELSETPEVSPVELPDMPADLAHDEPIELNAIVSPVESPLETPEDRVPPTPPVGNTAAPSPSFDTIPTSFNPNTAPPNVEVYQSNDGAYFLAGGILGYMLGRRRGRIKTERRMKAVTQKLEKQINDTRDQIARQETVIRNQARDRYNQAHGAETTAARTETNQPPAEHVQQMNQPELLALADKVVIDGTSLRTIYEAKQITEPGLRHIAREYLSGGDVRAALKHELMVKEMQYERDPQMRDRLAASYAGVDEAKPQAASDGMAQLYAHGSTPSSQPTYSSAEQLAAAEARQDRGKQLLVRAWVVLIVVLVIVAVMLAAR